MYMAIEVQVARMEGNGITQSARTVAHGNDVDVAPAGVA